MTDYRGLFWFSSHPVLLLCTLMSLHVSPASETDSPWMLLLSGRSFPPFFLLWFPSVTLVSQSREDCGLHLLPSCPGRGRIPSAESARIWASREICLDLLRKWLESSLLCRSATPSHQGLCGELGKDWAKTWGSSLTQEVPTVSQAAREFCLAPNQADGFQTCETGKTRAGWHRYF